MKKIIISVLALTALFSGCRKIDDAVSADASLTVSLTQMTFPGETEQTETIETEYSDTEFPETAETELSDTEITEMSETEKYIEASSETASEVTELSVETSVSETEKDVPAGGETENVPETAGTAAELTYIDGILVVNKTYPVPADYNPGVDPEAQSAFDKMQSDAYELGLNIYISSGFRSYDYQAGLYQRYVNQSGQAEADRYSARPGHSEHQTGLAFDLNTITDEFKDTDEGKWVAGNCHNYGFIIRYPADKESVTGYMSEPWHIRYLGVETAQAVHDSGLCLEEYLGITSQYADT
ncbi:MAG: M15 family metallopeptidase [Oscillospiraceae bacterium]|nr:M15 family metallopeptidase [Oscillospiraceae bacterium]